MGTIAVARQQRSHGPRRKHRMSDPKPVPKETVAPKERESINRHFLREGRWMVWLGVGLPILSLVVASLLGPLLLNALNK